MNVVEVPFGERNTKDAVFVGLFVRKTYPYKGFQEVSKKIQESPMSRLIMICRWDGSFGFVGGLVEPGERLKNALMREASEEIGLNLGIQRLQPIISHRIKDDLNAHFYACEISEEEMHSIMRKAPDAEHFAAECSGIVSLQIFNANGRGINNFLDNAFLAPAIREEAEALFKKEHLNNNKL